MTKVRGIVAFGFLLVACEAQGPPPEPGSTATAATCVSKGGNWQPVCLSRTYRCVTSYPDAGKACADSDQCAGDCVVDLATDCFNGDCVEPVIPKRGDLVDGICEADDDPCGSKIEVLDGRAQQLQNRD